MRKLPKEEALQAAACLACIVVLWIRLDDFRASEFGGGWLTGPLFRMADLSALFFLAAAFLIFFLRRTAATLALAAVLLCLPFYFYILLPGSYRWVFKGEYSVPVNRPFYWDPWAAVGVLSLLCVAALSLRSYFKIQTGA
jgi:hypothetical protein